MVKDLARRYMFGIGGNGKEAIIFGRIVDFISIQHVMVFPIAFQVKTLGFVFKLRRVLEQLFCPGDLFQPVPQDEPIAFICDRFPVGLAKVRYKKYPYIDGI